MGIGTAQQGRVADVLAGSNQAGLALDSRSAMTSSVTFLPLLTSFSIATRSSLRRAAFARLHASFLVRTGCMLHEEPGSYSTDQYPMFFAMTAYLRSAYCVAFCALFFS